MARTPSYLKGPDHGDAMKTPNMRIPKSAHGTSRMQNAGGKNARTGGGTLKSGGFKGGFSRRGSVGQVGPGTGFQGSKVKGNRQKGRIPSKQSHMGFREQA